MTAHQILRLFLILNGLWARPALAEPPSCREVVDACDKAISQLERQVADLKQDLRTLEKKASRCSEGAPAVTGAAGALGGVAAGAVAGGAAGLLPGAVVGALVGLVVGLVGR